MRESVLHFGFHQSAEHESGKEYEKLSLEGAYKNAVKVLKGFGETFSKVSLRKPTFPEKTHIPPQKMPSFSSHTNF